MSDRGARLVGLDARTTRTTPEDKDDEVRTLRDANVLLVRGDAGAAPPASSSSGIDASSKGRQNHRTRLVHSWQRRRRRSSHDNRRRHSAALFYPHDVECLEQAMMSQPPSVAHRNGDDDDDHGEEIHHNEHYLWRRNGDGARRKGAPDQDDHGALPTTKDVSTCFETVASRSVGAIGLDDVGLTWHAVNHTDDLRRGPAQLAGAEPKQATVVKEVKSRAEQRQRSGSDGTVDSVTDLDVLLLRRCLEEGSPMIGTGAISDETRSAASSATTVLHPQVLDRLQASLVSAAPRRPSAMAEGPTSDSTATSSPNNAPTIHVIAGAHGSGKTRLVQLAAARNGLVLLTGRSDSVASTNHPYRAYVLAAEEWCHQVTQKRLSAAEMRQLRHTLLNDLERDMGWKDGGISLGDDRHNDVRMLTTIIPALAPLLLGNGMSANAAARDAAAAATTTAVLEQPDDPSNGDSMGAFAPNRRASLSASIAVAAAADDRDASNSHGVNHRFTLLIRTFLRSVLSCPLDGQPVVLLLDDAHWLDRASMDLLASVLTGEGYYDDGDNIPRLQVIMTVRNDDPSLIEASEGWQRLKDWAASPDSSPTAVSLAYYDLSPLDANAVGQWLGRSLNMDAIERTSHLGSVIHRHARGNPRSVVNMCCYLQEVQLLHLDRSSHLWSWNVEDIDQALSSISAQSTNRPSDCILNARLGLLPVEITEVLMVAACLGPTFDESLLGLLIAVPVGRSLATAKARGYLGVRRTNPLVIDTASQLGARSEFGSDQVHVACYQHIPLELRPQLHLSIGQTIWNSLQDDESLETQLFAILSQLFLSMEVLEKGRYSDKEVAASLCLHGGIRAAMSSSFRIASNYLDMGIRLLRDQGWVSSYELALALHSTAAEMAMCNSDLTSVTERIDAVFVHATSMLDKVPVVATKIQSLCLGGKYEEARDLAVKTLRSLGEPFPSNITAMRLVLLFRRVYGMLQNKSNEQVLRIPDMENKAKLACMRLLHLMGTAVVNTTPEMIPYVGLKMVRLTVKHGLSPFASFAFVMMGTLSQALYGDLASGLRFGQLGLRLCHRYGRKEFLPRVYGLYFGLTHVWSRPIHEVLVPLRRGFEVGLRTGDMEGAFLCGRMYCMTAAETGVHLQVALHNFQRLCDAVRNSQHTGILPPLLCEVQAIHHLMGLSDDPLSSKGNVVDSDAALSEAIANGQHMSAYAIRMLRMKVCYVFNDYQQAASVMVTQFHKVPPVFNHCVGVMIAGLVVLANAKSRQGWRYGYRRVVRTVIKKLRHLSLQCPENILDKLSLVQAELLSVQGGRDAEAYEKYVCALAMAEKRKVPFMVALINERTARHLMDVEDANGFDPVSSLSSSPESLRFFQQAVRSFEDMGANAKVRQLREEMARRYGVAMDSSPEILPPRSKEQIVQQS